MNKIKLVTAIATSAILLGAMAPAAFAATDVVVAENGAFAKTNVKVKNVKATKVAQSNKSHVTNVVKSKANSGNNTSSFNTGGSTGVSTKPATSNVDVKVGGSSNTANLNSDCGCVGSDTSVAVVGNGAFSENSVKVSNSSWLAVMQSNVSTVLNVVTSSSNSGGNTSSFNTGGSTSVDAGAATSNVDVVVNGSSNTLNQ